MRAAATPAAAARPSASRRAARRGVRAARPPPPARSACDDPRSGRLAAAASDEPRSVAAAAALLAPPLPAEQAQAQAPAPDALLPQHPLLRRGELPNGLRYVILPNPTPPNRFEAHLEVHAGSVDEGEAEQGVAHFVEHVVFLGSRKRERLLGTGARSNAYTDFHHTVFHVHAPTVAGEEEGGGGGGVREGAAAGAAAMLPVVLDALVDIAFKPLFAESRVEKERKAVLVEAGMMNTIEYRVDCALLQHLHWENALGCRFPIGMPEQVAAWPSAVLKSFHSRNYFPANATLYIVGDLLPGAAGAADADAAAAAVEAAFGGVPAAAGEGGAPRARPALRPPVTHAFAMPSALSLALEAGGGGAGGVLGAGAAAGEASPRLFQHALLEQFSLSLFSKLPVLPIRNASHLRRTFAQRIVMAVVASRFGRAASQPGCPFVSADLDHSDSGREGCAVSTLTVTCAARAWRPALASAVAECRRLALHGVTRAELSRYTAALLRDSEQLAQQSGTVPSADNLTFIMESDALGHVVMDQRQGHAALLQVAPPVTLAECAAAGAELLGYVAFYRLPAAARDPRAGVATAIVACVPETAPADGDEEGPPLPFLVTEAEIGDVLAAAAAATDGCEAAEEVEVPDALVSPAALAALAAAHAPRFVLLDGTEPPAGWAPPPPAAGGVACRRLSNGLRVNWRRSASEPSGASLRLCAPGGRAAEPRAPGPGGLGAVAVGARALSDAGGVGEWAREQVELFCLQRLLTMTIEADEEWLKVDMHFAVSGGGLRGALELLHLLLTAPRWEAGSVERAKAAFSTHVRSGAKSLERAASRRLMEALSGGDGRWMDPDEAAVGALTLDGVRDAVTAQLGDVARLELNLVGDFEGPEVDALLLLLLGSIPPAPAPAPPPPPEAPIALAALPLAHPLRHQRLLLADSDERAVTYAAGGAPNRWGWGWAAEAGSSSAAAAAAAAYDGIDGGAAVAMPESTRRAHPLYHAACLSLLTEVVNSRLFTTVRDALGLTYDVSFELSNFDRLPGGWYQLSVTSTPARVDEALSASLRTLRGLGQQRVSGRELERARRTLLTRHESELKDNNYLLGLLTHCQSLRVPRKNADALADIELLYNAVTVADLYCAFDSLQTRADQVFTCTGVSGDAAAAAEAAAEAAAAAAAAAPAAAPGTLPDPRALEAALAALGGSAMMAEWKERFAAAKRAEEAAAAAARAEAGGEEYL